MSMIFVDAPIPLTHEEKIARLEHAIEYVRLAAKDVSQLELQVPGEGHLLAHLRCELRAISDRLEGVLVRASPTGADLLTAPVA